MWHYAWHNVIETSKIKTRYQLIIWRFQYFPNSIYDTYDLVALLQACVCDNVIYCRNIHISLHEYGCIWHWKVEDDQIKVLVLSTTKQLFFMKSLREINSWYVSHIIYGLMHVSVPYMYKFIIAYYDGATTYIDNSILLQNRFQQCQKCLSDNDLTNLLS